MTEVTTNEQPQKRKPFIGAPNTGLNGTLAKKRFYASGAGQTHLRRLKEEYAAAHPPTTERGRRRRAKKNGGQ